MQNIIEAVAEIFKRAGCNYELDEQPSLVRTQIVGASGEWHFQAVSLNNIIMMLSGLPFRIPKARRSVCAELLTRINCACKMGAFTVHFDDGELIAKVSCMTNGETMPSEQLEFLVNANLASMDRFIPAIMSVVYAGISPSPALERANGEAQLSAAQRIEGKQSGDDEIPLSRN